MTALPARTFPGGWSVLLGIAALLVIRVAIPDPRMQAYAVGIVVAAAASAQLVIMRGTEYRR